MNLLQEITSRDGIPFEQFALGCAMHLGVALEADSTVVATQFEPFITVSRNRLAELDAMTPATAEQAALHEYLDATEGRQKTKREAAVVNARIATMLDQVRAWRPPTPAHVGLHDFMASRLERTLIDVSEPDPVHLTGEQWLAKSREMVTRSIARLEAMVAEDTEACAVRNAWVKALRSSLTPNAG